MAGLLLLLPVGAGAACVTNQDCNDGNLCTTDTCSAGTCSNQNNALPCSDGNACTVGDTCGNGLCGSGSPMNCDDSNSCTDDICDSNLGCLHAANSSACTDSNSCTSDDVCNGEVCVGGNKASGCTSCQAVANIPADGGTFVGTTSGTSNLAGTCANTSSAPERVYRWIPANSGPAQIQTCGTGTNYDTALYLRQSNCTSGAEVACNDDTIGCGVADGTTNASKHGSRINPTVTAGQTYFIVVDGYSTRSGTYTLTVTPPSVCGNNVREGLEECDGSQVSGCISGQCSAQCTCVPPASGLPDLTPNISSVSVVFNTTAASGDVAEGCAESTSSVDLMRFSVTSSNVGTANFALGNPGCPSPCDEHPLEICTNPQFVCSPAEGHNHAHYDNYAKYELLDQTGQALVVGHKQGFCLRDSSSCANPLYTCTDQGISAGCSDIYASTLGCQYLDITGVPSGTYTLRVSVDPFSRITELAETNNVDTVSVTIPLRPSTTTSTTTPSSSTSTTTSSSTTSTTLASGTCANPTVLPSAGGTFPGTTTGSSALAGTCANSSTSPEKVFQWTPSASGTATIRTCSTATNYDTVVYMRQASCSSGTQVACNDDTDGCAVGDGTTNADHHGSVITPTVTAGQTYFIVVDGYNGKKGNFSLTIIPPAGATTTSTVPTTTSTTSTTSTSTTSSTSTTQSTTSTSSTSTTSTSTSTSTTSTSTSSTSTSSTSTTSTTSTTESTTSTSSTTSTTESTTSTSTIFAEPTTSTTSTTTSSTQSTTSTSSTSTTSTTSPTLPAACQAPTVIQAEGGSFNGTTSGTSSLAGTCANSGTSPEKVFQWTPSRSGAATIRTCGTATTFDTILYVRGGSCTGTQVACNDDTQNCAVSDGTPNSFKHGSVVTPTVTAGQTYFIVVDGYKGKSGNFGLTVIPPP